MKSKIVSAIRESIKVKKDFLENEALLKNIEDLAQECLSSLRAGGKIIFAGNGGSFSDAQHLSAEFTSRLNFDRAPMASLVLGTNASSMSAIGNDYGFESVFSREIEGIARPQDLFICLSTSGNSKNIINAILSATKMGVHTVAFTGQGGGKLVEYCRCIHVPSNKTTRIQECHILLGHILCELVEHYYYLNVK